MRTNGTLVDASGAGKAAWPGYRVTFELTELLKVADDDAPIPTDVEISGDVALDGTFRVDLPEKDAIAAPVVVKVLAPAGEVLKSESIAIGALSDGLQLAVTPKAVFEIPRNVDRFLGDKPKPQGRVLDFDGKRQIANKQVIVFGVRNQIATPLVVARTDGQGYFSADYPRDTDARGAVGGPVSLDSAHAVVAGAQDVGGNAEVPIQLTSMYSVERTLPRSIVLVVKGVEDPLAPPAPEKDCDCSGTDVPRAPDAADLAASSAYSTDLGGGKCVNLNVPNRAVEEYSFYTAVRTTDPDIVGTQDGSFDVAPPERIRSVLSGLTDVVVSAPPPAAPPRSRLMARATDTAPAVHAAVRAPINTILLSSALGRRGASLDHALDEAVRTSEVAHATTLLKRLTPRPPGRSVVSAKNRIRWDDDAKFYEATSIAHGHLLHFKQVWRADGYSLGDLLYSLPLAPGQKKQIAVVDWERRESGRREESLTESESLSNLLGRDRDISEIVNTALSEQMHGESTSLTIGAGHGSGAAGSGSSGGFNMGAVSGSAMSGGYSQASADQNSARDLAASSAQKIRDKTFQAASAVRNQRSTVIQTVAQGETMTVTTEVIANHNHCHAMTIEYFEVLRHFVVSVELAAVSECLYVPLEMAPFTRTKALRWRDQLSRFMRKPALLVGFDALQRIEDGSASDLPANRYADEEVRFVDGSLTVEIRTPSGKDEGFVMDLFNKLKSFLLGSDAQRPLANPHLQINAMVANSPRGLPISFTLLGDFAPGVPLAVRMYPSGPIPPGISRTSISGMQLRWDKAAVALPEGTVLIVRSAQMRYRTDHMNGTLFDERALNSSLADDQVFIDTPLTAAELRNPHKEDESLEKKLLAHLNEHLEYYHKAIWWGMDPDRRFMLLDGFLAPNANGRSVASVVENRLIGFIGNSMILPVGPGIHLDPTYTKGADGPTALLDIYAADPSPPVRVSVPTRGVFAEAVMGSCNACEQKDETRYWRWEESAIDEPTAIQSPSTDSRKSDSPDLKAQPFPTPMVNIQNAPSLPDPTGLAAALKVIGTPNLFPNITGLDQTQKNSLEALKANLEAAKYFGGEASKLAQSAAMQKGGIDKSLQSINQAEKSGMISSDQKNDLAVKALKGLIGEGASDGAKKKSSIDELAPSVKKQVEKGGVKSLEAEGESGEKLKAAFQPDLILASNTTTGGGSTSSSTTSTGTASSASLLVPVVVTDRILADGVVDAVVALIKPGTAEIEAPSPKTVSRGRTRLDLTNVDDGVYDLLVSPDPDSTWDLPVGPSLVGSQRRMWRTEKAIVAVKGKQIVGVFDPAGSPSARFSLGGDGSLNCIVEPVWVAQDRRFSPGGQYQPNAPTLIIVHHTGGANDGADTVKSFKSSNKGAHYVIHRNGEVTKMVNESERAAHVDKTEWVTETNLGNSSVGIEMANQSQTYTDEQYESLLGLLERLTSELGIARHRVVGHSDVGLERAGVLGSRDVDPSEGGSSDPGQHFDWSRLQDAGFSIVPAAINPWPNMYGGIFAANPAAVLPTSGAAVAELRDDLVTIGYAAAGSGAPTTMDTSLLNALRAFVLHFVSGPLAPLDRVLKKSGGPENGVRVDAALADLVKRVRAAVLPP